MSENEIKRCRFCMAFESTGEHVGECHRFPPLVWISKEAYESLPNDISRDIYNHRWPIVDWDDWCYEFTQIPWKKIKEMVTEDYEKANGTRIP